MSNDPRSNPTTLSVHLPVAVLALAIAIFLFSQARSISSNNDYTRWQLNNMDKQQAQLVQSEKQLKEAYTQREGTVKQAEEIWKKTQEVLNDVLELSKEDEDAKKIVANFKIQKPAAPAATPAPEKKP